MEPTAASKDEVIKREVCQVITRGTYIDLQNGIHFLTYNDVAFFSSVKFIILQYTCITFQIL